MHMARQDPTQPFTCPECGGTRPRERYVRGEYSCPECNLSVAHVDLAPTGAVREVLGWLLNPGDVLIGRYRVVSLLGRGGFAATYAVEDIRLSNRRCALKEVPKLLFDDGETEILSRLHHPGIPDIRDRFEERDMVYLVLEFGGSRSLNAERIERGGRIPAATVLPWIRQLCDVLRYLHSQNPPIVHRDLKPANVLLNEAGQINLIDFGIAKDTGSDAQTRTIARSATHGFSPPEQVLGTGTDQRSDVYALGATLYVLLTGQKPPPAHQRVAGAELTPPNDLVPDLPAGLDSLIMRSVELNINRRVQSIAEFEASLAALERGAPLPDPAAAGREASIEGRSQLVVEESATIHAPTAPPAPRRRLAWLAAIIALLMVAGATWWTKREPVEAPAQHMEAASGRQRAPELPPSAVPLAPEAEPARPAAVVEPAPEAGVAAAPSSASAAPVREPEVQGWRPPEPAGAGPVAPPAPDREPAARPPPAQAPASEAETSEPDWGAGFRRGTTIRTN